MSTLPEDSVTIWPIGSKPENRLTRKQARECNPPYLPPLGDKWMPNQITAHRDKQGRQMTARQLAETDPRTWGNSVYTTQEVIQLGTKGNEASIAKAAQKKADLQASAKSSEATVMLARANLAKERAKKTMATAKKK